MIRVIRRLWRVLSVSMLVLAWVACGASTSMSEAVAVCTGLETQAIVASDDCVAVQLKIDALRNNDTSCVKAFKGAHFDVCAKLDGGSDAHD